MTMDNLLKEALIKYISGVILVGLLLFVPAGTLKWNEGRLFMIVLFVPMFVAGLIMYFKAKDLLKSRLNVREKQSEQKDVISYSALMFLASFILAGLNRRFGWSDLPKSVIAGAAVVFLFGYLLFGEVLRENAYLSRTIEVRKDQKVVESGLYGIVRHPMYSATVLMFLSMPLILNCIYSFVIMLAYIPLIIKRIRNEEVFLEKELQGYSEYKKKVEYRLLPYIW